MVSDYISIHGITWVSVAWFQMYLISLYMYYRNADKRALDRKWAIAMTIIILGMYNPLSIRLVKPIMAGNIEYTRIAWAILMVPVISYCLVLLLPIKEKKVASAVLVAITIIALLGVNDRLYFRMPENKYKVSDESIKLVEQLDQVAGDKAYYTVCFLDPVTYIGDLTGDLTEYDEVYYGMTMYTARFRMRAVPESWVIENDVVVDYVITEQALQSMQLQEYGYFFVTQSGKYNIYSNKVGK